MNVKANNLVSKIKKIKKLFIMPSSGDESLSLGAALHCYYEKTKDRNFNKSILKNLYLGKKNSKLDEDYAVKKLIVNNNKYSIFKKNINQIAANLLFSGKVIFQNYLLHTT